MVQHTGDPGRVRQSKKNAGFRRSGARFHGFGPGKKFLRGKMKDRKKIIDRCRFSTCVVELNND